MKQVEFKKTGYGQYSASTVYYGKEISMHITDSIIYDLIMSEDKGWKRASKLLRNKIILANK